MVGRRRWRVLRRWLRLLRWWLVLWLRRLRWGLLRQLRRWVRCRRMGLIFGRLWCRRRRWRVRWGRWRVLRLLLRLRRRRRLVLVLVRLWCLRWIVLVLVVLVVRTRVRRVWLGLRWRRV
ncbi:hypothetical protein [Mycolicibacterium peregrinum]|uniref:hypothetical protein n=1 Tax=Mycolicibacterium peregrinum TaxID=43304 RepID=UPI003AACA333